MRKIIVFLICFLPSIAISGVDTFEGQTGTDTWEGQTGVDTREGQAIAVVGGATNYTEDANIVSWWMLEEASSTRLDGSANNNDLTPVSDGTLGNSATHVQGTYSAAFVATSYECMYRADADLAPSTFPGKTTTGGTGAFSIGGWFYLTDTGTERVLITKGANGGAEDRSYALRYDGTNAVFDISTAGWYSTSITGTTALSATTWYHIVGVYTGTEIQIWLGTAAGASAQDQTAVEFTDIIYRGTGDFVIGALLSNGNTPYNGLADEVFIFADALAEAEIEEIRAHGLAGER